MTLKSYSSLCHCFISSSWLSSVASLSGRYSTFVSEYSQQKARRYSNQSKFTHFSRPAGLNPVPFHPEKFKVSVIQKNVPSMVIHLPTRFFGIYACIVLYLFCLTFSFKLFLSNLSPDVLQLPEGGDFLALHCQPSTKFDRSTMPFKSTEPPLLGRCC